MKWIGFWWCVCAMGVVHAEEAVSPVRQTTLRDRIPHVSQRLYRQAGEWEVYTALGTSLSDPLVLHGLGRMQLAYHFTEEWALAVSGEGAWAYRSSGQRVVGGSPGLQVFDGIRARAQASVLWAPLYGKFSWFASKAVHFNTYLVWGASALRMTHSGMHAGVHVGVGQRFWVYPHWALRVEVLSDVFPWDRVDGPEGSERWQQWMTLNVGVSYDVGGPRKEPVSW
jgi:outer membrane beta-barrel protein